MWWASPFDIDISGVGRDATAWGLLTEGRKSWGERVVCAIVGGSVGAAVGLREGRDPLNCVLQNICSAIESCLVRYAGNWMCIAGGLNFECMLSG